MPMNRAYISSEEVSQAIIDAGMNLRPEDQLSTKFSIIAQRLSEIMRQKVRAEIEAFASKVLR